MKKHHPEKAHKRKRLRIHEITSENDIRYRGPLSYLHFQLLGWMCLVAAQGMIILKLGGRMDPTLARDSAGILRIFQSVSSFSLPFLLIANFTRILNASEGYRNQLLKNIAASAAIAGVFYLFFYRYLIGAIEALFAEPEIVLPMVEAALGETLKYGFLSFNIFIDLFLCTLVMLFLNYRPVRLFRGKSVIVFRLLALLPIGYEVFCMVLKIQAAGGDAAIPVWMWPLLPVKPFMTFILFILLALFVKTRELRFRRHGKTHAEYQAFLKTKRNSWNFSVFLAVMMVVISLLDFAVLLGFSLNESMPLIMQDLGQTETVPEAGQEGDAAEEILAGSGKAEASGEYIPSEETAAAIEKGADKALAVGFGGSVNLFILAPLMLLFSYTRVPRNKKIGMLIPPAGIIFIVFLYLETLHMVLPQLPIRKLTTEDIVQFIVSLSSLVE